MPEWEAHTRNDGTEFWVQAFSCDVPEQAKHIRKTARQLAKMEEAPDAEFTAVKALRHEKYKDPGSSEMRHAYIFIVSGWNGDVSPNELQSVLKKVNARQQQGPAPASSSPASHKRNSRFASTDLPKRFKSINAASPAEDPAAEKAAAEPLAGSPATTAPSAAAAGGSIGSAGVQQGVKQDTTEPAAKGRSRAASRRARSDDDTSSGSDWTTSESDESTEGGALLQDKASTKGGAAGKHKKELAPVEHSAVEYSTFRKKFYVEAAADIKSLSAEEVEEMRKASAVVVRGQDIPSPVKTWAHCGINVKVLEVLKKYGYDKPLPIQAQALPIITSGRDCFGIAKSGCGKTLAFVLPMLRHIRDQPDLQAGDGPVALVLAPTREAVVSISKVVSAFGAPLSMSCTAVFKGAGVSILGQLQRGTQVVAATPGRLTELLIKDKTNLRRVTYLVLDEPDVLLDMGLESQVKRITDNIRPDRQSIMFTSTSSPAIEALARDILTNPVEVKVGAGGSSFAAITQHVGICTDDERYGSLLELLEAEYSAGKFLVLTSSVDRCQQLYRQLTKDGVPCLCVHDDMTTHDRSSIMNDFKGAICNICVSTHAAACGVAVPGLLCPVNYDVPSSAEAYGDSLSCFPPASLGKATCTAITFIGPDEEQYAPGLIEALEDCGAGVPDCLRDLAAGFYRHHQEQHQQHEYNDDYDNGFGDGFVDGISEQQQHDGEGAHALDGWGIEHQQQQEEEEEQEAHQHQQQEHENQQEQEEEGQEDGFSQERPLQGPAALDTAPASNSAHRDSNAAQQLQHEAEVSDDPAGETATAAAADAEHETNPGTDVLDSTAAGSDWEVGTEPGAQQSPEDC